VFPAITKVKKVFQEAFFGSAVKASGIKTKQGYVYAISSRAVLEPDSHFYASGRVSGGQLEGYVTDGFVNGVKVDGRSFSGTAPAYVCLKFTAPNGGDVAIEVRNTFGYQDDVYYYPLAAFGKDGKIAQLVFSGLLYRARRKVPGFYWMHEISAA
jgi:hypothetical protein